MICPNFKNQKVRQEFEEISDVVGEEIAYDIWNQNNGYGIDMAPNGEPSILFQSLLDLNQNDRIKAIQAKAKTFSKSFKEWSGESFVKDENGEPYIKFTTEGNGFYDNGNTKLQIQRAISTEDTSLPQVLNDVETISDTAGLIDYVIANDTDQTRVNIAVAFKQLLDEDKISNIPVIYDATLTRAGQYSTVRNVDDTVRVGTDFKFSPQLIMDLSAGDISSLFMHELAHHFATNAVINDNIASKAVNRMYEAYKEAYSDYATESVIEFVAEALSNPETLANLRELNYSNTKTWYDKLWDTIRNVFNKLLGKDPIVKELTNYIKNYADNNILPSIKSENQIDLVQEIFNSERAAMDTMNNSENMTRMDHIQRKAAETLKRSKENLESRIKSVKSRGGDPSLTRKLQRDLRVLEDSIEDSTALFNLIKHISNSFKEPLALINKAYNNPDTIGNKALLQFKQDYLGFYDKIFTDVKELFDTNYFHVMLDPADLDFTIQQVGLINNVLSSMKAKYNVLVKEKAEQALRGIGIQAGSPTIGTYIDNNLYQTDSDISWFELYMGSLNNANDEALRVMYYAVQNVKNDIERTTIAKGKELTFLSGNVSNIASLSERGTDGKKTGYLIRNRNYGEFRNNYETFLDELGQKYGLKDRHDIPLNNDDYKAYNKEKNAWLSKHAERRYVPEYYDLYADLSRETQEERQNVQVAIDKLLNQARDSKGNVDLTKLSQNKWEQLKKAYRTRRELANKFHANGEPKYGIELDIANEISAVNEKVQENLFYKPNHQKFQDAMNKAKETLTPEQFKVWMERNTQEEYAKEFWDLMELTAKNDYGEVYAELLGYRQELFKLYRNLNNIQVDGDIIPEQARKFIEDIDKALDDIRSKSIKRLGEIRFSDIATTETTIQYDRARAEAVAKDKTNPGAFAEWVKANHYINSRGKQVPYSFWTYIKPKNPEYILQTPSRAWSEIDPDSPWYNHNFDNESEEYIQPKKELYDNQANYDQAMSDPKLKRLYEALVDTMRESNSKLSFRQHIDPYKLPQISGTMWQHITSNNSVIKGFKKYTKDALTVNNDDIDFTGSVVKNPDGSQLYFVPTHYLKTLDFPETLTNDTVGSIIEYFRMADNFMKMNSIAPTIEIIKEQLASRTYEKNANSLTSKLLPSQRRGETIAGNKTRTYEKADQFLRQHIYGENKLKMEWKVGKNTYSITKIMTKIRNYTQTVNLGLNITAVEAGFLTSMHNALMEAVTDRYFSVSDFAVGHTNVLKNLLQTIFNWGNQRSNNKVLALLEYNQVSRTNSEIFKKLNYTRAGRFITNHFWYGGFSGGDYIVKSSILNALYNNHKLVTDPTTGQKSFMSKRQFIDKYYPTDISKGQSLWKAQGITLYDAYDSNDGLAYVKPEYEQYVNEDLKNKITNTAQFLASKADGVLNDLDRSHVHAHAFWQMVFMHRNFLVVNLQDRVSKKKGYNYQTGMFDEALYRTAWRNIATWWKASADAVRYLVQGEFQKSKEAWKSRKEGKDFSDRSNLKKIAWELAALASYLLLSAYWDDRADRKNSSWAEQHIAYMVKRTAFEVEAMYDPTDVIGLVQSPSAAMGTLNQIGFLSQIVFTPFILSWDNNHGKKIKRGPYKGMTRGEQALIKATPFKHIIEAQEPNLKRKYLSNLIMQ